MESTLLNSSGECLGVPYVLSWISLPFHQGSRRTSLEEYTNLNNSCTHNCDCVLVLFLTGNLEKTRRRVLTCVIALVACRSTWSSRGNKVISEVVPLSPIIQK